MCGMGSWPSELEGWRKGDCGKSAPRIYNHKPRNTCSPQKLEEPGSLLL